MYKIIVANKVNQIFGELSKGNCEPLLNGLADDATHWMGGAHALSGRRTNNDDIAQWYQRLLRLFPELTFDVQRVVVAGLPHNTVVSVQWADSSATVLEKSYQNVGVNIIGLSWGKVTSIEIHTDSQVVSEYLEKLGESDPEAVAPPILS